MGQIFLLIILVATAFSGGWVVASWRHTGRCAIEKNEVLVSEVQAQVERLGELKEKLTEVIEEADDLSAVTNAALDGMNNKVQERNVALNDLETRTRALSREIRSLEHVDCVLPSVYTRLYREISETANSNRHAVYGPPY